MDVRLAGLDDAEGIRAIYNREVLEGTATFDLRPRSITDQRRWLTDRSGAHAVVVAIEDPVVLGFGSLSPYRDRPAYRTTVEDSVYVDPAHQGRGVGRAVLDGLLQTATQHGFHAVVARISGPNEASVALHRACGFETVGIEREVGRKFSRWLDVVVMQRILA
ncbi:GNAT family N-acetyltransferase [Iamia sp.]|uniref:GNAT family N-acetyltransferase n=1 Tax=Iamia sp. TaxID=2722710 RepID=UPI002C093591|nr:GNAT family N-acetyltransferase [Iamia sp.]HXH57964.1 GNAT family N-acetyltransferase [Iamia sp.]